MKLNTLVENKIFEKLGVLSSLEDLTNNIIEKLKKSKSTRNGTGYYYLKTKLNNIDVKLHFYATDDNESGTFTKIKGENEYQIYTPINSTTLLHELKHLDRDIRINQNAKVKDKIDLRSLGKNLENDIGINWLSTTIYYSNQDEFEAFFNDIYHKLKKEINEKMTNQEKKDIINTTLNRERIYSTYKEFYPNKFDLLSIDFKKIDIRKYISEYLKLEKLIKFNQKETSKEEKEQIKLNWRAGIYENINPDKFIKSMNIILNNSIKKNFIKFDRLYTLFNVF